jgi:hypothetical protein
MQHDGVATGTSFLAVLLVTLHVAGLGGGGGRAEGEFFFVWILLALGAASAFLLLLAVRGLWRLRSAERAEVG